MGSQRCNSKASRLNPFDATNVQGGTQDNGTFQTTGSTTVWPQIIYGDGGQSGFNATNPALRVNTFSGQANDVNFHNGDPSLWVIAISETYVSSPEGSYFYPPIIADPNPANGRLDLPRLLQRLANTGLGRNQAFLRRTATTLRCRLYRLPVATSLHSGRLARPT